MSPKNYFYLKLIYNKSPKKFQIKICVQKDYLIFTNINFFNKSQRNYLYFSQKKIMFFNILYICMYVCT